MKTRITKREVYAFLLGAVVMILIQFFADFKNNIKDFKEGFNEGYKNDKQEDTR